MKSTIWTLIAILTLFDGFVCTPNQQGITDAVDLPSPSSDSTDLTSPNDASSVTQDSFEVRHSVLRSVDWSEDEDTDCDTTVASPDLLQLEVYVTTGRTDLFADLIENNDVTKRLLDRFDLLPKSQPWELLYAIFDSDLRLSFLQSIISSPLVSYAAPLLLQIAFERHESDLVDLILSCPDVVQSCNGGEAFNQALHAFIRYQNPSVASFFSMVQRKPFASWFNALLVLDVIDAVASVGNTDLFAALIWVPGVIHRLSFMPIFTQTILTEAVCNQQTKFFSYLLNDLADFAALLTNKPQILVTALRSAIEEDQMEFLRVAMEAPFFSDIVNVADIKDEMTLFQTALLTGSKNAVDLLISYQHTDVWQQDRHGRGPLFYYLLSSPDIVEFLNVLEKMIIQSGCISLSQIVDDLEVAFIKACDPMLPEHESAIYDEFLGMLLTSYPFISDIVNTHAYREKATLLYFAVKYQHMESIIHLLSVPELKTQYDGALRENFQLAVKNVLADHEHGEFDDVAQMLRARMKL